MIIGEVLNIAGKATIAPENATNKAESYDSSKPEVATVSDTGEIKALSEGKTTITVEVDGVKASFELNVEKETVVITSIAFTNASEGGRVQGIRLGTEPGAADDDPARRSHRRRSLRILRHIGSDGR